MIFLFLFFKAKEDDVSWLDTVINDQFPYTFFSRTDISRKIFDCSFCIWCAFQNNTPIGFVEGEFFENGECRVNAVWVDDFFRRQGVATNLVKKIIAECKKRNVEKIFLLVKENNVDAKSFYKKIGFVFDKTHDKIIDNSKIEVWVLKN